MQESSLPLMSIHEGNASLQPLIARFIASIPDRLNELRNALANADHDGIKRSTHKFRGSASTFGFPQVTSTIQRVEESWIQLSLGLCSEDEVLSAYNRLLNQCCRLTSNRHSCNLDPTKLELMLNVNSPKNHRSRNPNQNGSGAAFSN